MKHYRTHNAYQLASYPLLLIGLLVGTRNMALATINPSTSLEDRLAQIHNLTADFEQTTYSNKGETLAKSFGSIAIKHPGKLRWDIKKPLPQLIMVNDGKTYVYDATLKQLTIYKSNAVKNPTPLRLLSTQVNDLNHYFAVNQKGQQYTLTVKQQKSDNNSSFKQIVLNFNKNNLKNMIFYTKLGQYSVIKFSNMKINTLLAHDTFKMKTPPGTDIVTSP